MDALDQSQCPDCHLVEFDFQKHCPLDKTDHPSAQFPIRVLKLLPASSVEAEIRFKVKQRKDEDEEYDALSWCWGGGSSLKHARVQKGDGDLCFKLTENLDLALRNMRHKSQVLTLWIDYICIHQANTEEKDEQVPLMAEIYGKSNRVIIWLGDKDEESEVAMDFIRHKVLNLKLFDTLHKDNSFAMQWNALISLMKRPWFHRRWVVQEIALANYKKAIVRCGDRTLHWNEFADAVSLFNETETGTHRLSEIMKAVEEFGNIPDFFGHVPALGATRLVEATNDLFRTASNGNRDPLLSLEYLVSSFSIFEASEPRDTIFALLAIAKDTAPGSTRTVPDLEAFEEFKKSSASRRLLKYWGSSPRKSMYRVSYDLPLAKVYQEFITFSVMHADPLRALDVICRPWAPEPRKERGEATLPSWIPSLENVNFKLTEQDDSGPKTHRLNADPLVGLPGKHQYSAAGSHPLSKEDFDFRIGPGFMSLLAKGFIVDKISDITDCSQRAFLTRQWLNLGGWEDTERDDPPEDFWRTLVADRGPDGKNALSFYRRACAEAWKRSKNSGPHVHNLVYYGNSTVSKFLRRVEAVVWNRRLMKLKNKNLGLAPKDAQKGDLICILYGCSVPVVLRKMVKSKEQLKKEMDEAIENYLQSHRLAARRVIYALARWGKTAQRTGKPAPVVQKMLEQLYTLDRKNKRMINGAAPSDKLTNGELHKQYKSNIGLRKDKPSTGVVPNGKIDSNDTEASMPAPFFISPNQNAPTVIKMCRKVWPNKWRRRKISSAFSLALQVVLSLLGSLIWLVTISYWKIGPVFPWPGRREEPKKRPEVSKYYYKFIGECYVHGRMNGEAIDKRNEYMRLYGGASFMRNRVFELR